MTRRRDAKREIRRRMAATGERYTVARDFLFPDRDAWGGPQGEGSPMSTTTSPIHIELLDDQDETQRAAEQLREVVMSRPLDRLVYFDRIRVSSEARLSGGAHVPLLARSELLGGADWALVTFVHAQLHVALWDIANTAAATEETAVRWRWLGVEFGGRMPCGIEGLGRHITIAALERSVLGDLVGDERADAMLTDPALPGGRFRAAVYNDIAAVNEVLDRYEIRLPAQPPGGDRRGTRIPLGSHGTTAILATGKELEVDLAGRLASLHENYDLRPWCFSDTVVIDTGRPNELGESHPVLGTYFIWAPDALLAQNYLQVHGGWWVGRNVDQAALETAIGAATADFGWAPEFPRRHALQIVFSSVVSLHAASQLFSAVEIDEAIQRHPRNRALFEFLRPQLVHLIQRLERADVPTRRGMNRP